jgi:hypothetical protein
MYLFQQYKRKFLLKYAFKPDAQVPAEHMLEKLCVRVAQHPHLSCTELIYNWSRKSTAAGCADAGDRRNSLLDNCCWENDFAISGNFQIVESIASYSYPMRISSPARIALVAIEFP